MMLLFKDFPQFFLVSSGLKWTSANGYKKEPHILPYIIPEHSRPVRTFPFGIYIVYFSHSRFFFLSFCLFFQNTSYCFIPVLLQGTQKLKYPNTALSVVLQKGSFLTKWNKNCSGSVTNMGDDCICHDLCAGNNAHLIFTLNHLDGQQTSFLSLSVLINKLQ